MAFKGVLKDLETSPLRYLMRDRTKTLGLKVPEGNEREIYEAIGILKATIRQVLEREGELKARGRRKKSDIHWELPSNIEKNEVYAAEILDLIPPAGENPQPPSSYEGSVIKKHESDFRLSSFRFDEEGVIKDVQKVARSLIDFLVRISEEPLDSTRKEIALSAVQNGLIMILRENLLRLDEHLLFRADAFDPKPKHHEQKRFSSKTLRSVWADIGTEIEAGELEPEQANLELLKRLHFFSDDEAESFTPERVRDIEKQVRTCLYKAWKFYDEIGERLMEAQRDFSLQGEEIQVDPRSEIQAMSLFELLSFLFDKKKGHEEAGVQLKDYNDAQVILNLALRYLSVSNHPRLQKAIEERDVFQSKILNNAFEEGELITDLVHKDENGNVRPKGPKDDRWRSYVLRRLKPANGNGKAVVWWKQTRIKDDEAIIEKLLLKPSSTIEDVHDIIATTFVLWGTTESEMQNPAKTQKFINLAKKTGGNIGYTLREDITTDNGRSELQNGEFCVLDKTNGGSSERSVQYPSVRIYGLTEGGVTFEIQFVPQDGYFMAESPDSPNHHSKYKDRRAVAIGKRIYRGSGYPAIQAAIPQIEAHQEAERMRLTKKFKIRAKDATEVKFVVGPRSPSRPPEVEKKRK